MPLSATDIIAPAIEHTKKQLFQPFRLWQWARLALVGLCTGELGGSGGCNVPTNFPNPRTQGGSQRLIDPDIWVHHPGVLAALITIAIILTLVLWVVMIYINSRMRFVLFDTVIARECRIREYWRRTRALGMRYFAWQLVFGLIVMAGLVILLGIPAGLAYLAGWWQNPSAHLAPLILGGILLFFVFMAFLLCTILITVMTKDFVVPFMVMENISVMEGWRRLWPAVKTEKGNYAVYIGMKILLAIAAGIIFGIIGLIVLLIVVIPFVIIGILIGVGASSAALTWNVYTITLVVIGAIIFVAILVCVTALVGVPKVVFFTAYSIHFLASRYPALDALLHPAPPAPPTPPAPEIPPPMPPFLPSEPSPLGS